MGKISVGPPYFDSVFVPIMVPVVFLMGVGPLARWRQTEVPDLARRLRWAIALVIPAALATQWAAGKVSAMATLGFALSWWIVLSVATDLRERLMVGTVLGGSVWGRARQLPRATL